MIGEALIDIVERPGSAQEFVGGGPANTAIGLARLGVPVSLLTCLGDDDRGRRIADALADERVGLHPASAPVPRTSTARASIDARGSAEYSFDIHWRVPDVDIAPPRIVHAGSIGLFLEPGATALAAILRRQSGRSTITIDPNIRPSLLPEHPLALRRFEEAAALADLVKLSDEDAAWLYPSLGPEAAVERICSLGPGSCILTRGSDGVYARHRERTFELAAYRVTVADTISAGDSFMASVIAGLVAAHADPTPAEFLELLDSAARAAAFAVSVSGAAPPTPEQVAAVPSRLPPRER